MTVVTSLRTEELGVLSLQGRRIFSSPYAQTGSGFHRRACPMGAENRSRGKAVEACGYPLSAIYCRRLRKTEAKPSLPSTSLPEWCLADWFMRIYRYLPQL